MRMMSSRSLTVSSGVFDPLIMSEMESQQMIGNHQRWDILARPTAPHGVPWIFSTTDYGLPPRWITPVSGGVYTRSAFKAVRSLSGTSRYLWQRPSVFRLSCTYNRFWIPYPWTTARDYLPFFVNFVHLCTSIEIQERFFSMLVESHQRDKEDVAQLTRFHHHPMISAMFKVKQRTISAYWASAISPNSKRGSLDSRSISPFSMPLPISKKILQPLKHWFGWE